jgi:hypothetical protein
VNPGIYGLGGQIVTPVQGPFSGVADAWKMLSVQALLVGGGGGGSNAIVNGRPGPGGGGGGVLEQAIGITLGRSYVVTVGAGGASQANGSHSVFGQVCAAGGAGANNTGAIASVATGAGAISLSVRNTSLITPQGFSGGLAANGYGSPVGGGGGAGAQGGDSSVTAGPGTGFSGAGGAGRSSTIFDAYLYGGGGGGGAYSGQYAGSGGSSGGGGGSATSGVNGTSGLSNSGGGGGGGSSGPSVGTSGGSGGSGVVILRWNASQAQIAISSGLSFTRTTVGTDTVLTITAGTGTVSWS